jgi:cobalt-zinc-cadmium efflux system outer membrane protein
MRCNGLPWYAALAVAISFVPSDGRAEEPPRFPLGGALPAFDAPAEPAREDPGLPAEPGGVVRLPDALAAVLLRSAELAADAYEVRAREAALLQAGAYPNPTVSLELEDFAGTGELSGFDGAQTTVLLGQVIELGGKRAARIEVAHADRDLSAWDYEVRRIDVLARTAAAFVDVLAAQERHRLAGETLGLARSMRRVTADRLNAGIATSAEEIRAGVQVDVAAVELEHTEHGLATARQALAALWGGEAPRFDRAEGDLQRLPVPPAAEALERQLEASPSVARWRTVLARREALRGRARSDRVPDLAVHLGPRRLSGPEETALVVGLTVPIPLWDRNRGAIAEAEHRLAKTHAEARAARVEAATALAAARLGLAASIEEAHLLRARVLPGTERAVEALRDGYEQGRFAQIEVLDAERARLAAREQYLAALTEAHHSAQQIERLTGVPLEVRP